MVLTLLNVSKQPLRPYNGIPYIYLSLSPIFASRALSTTLIHYSIISVPYNHYFSVTSTASTISIHPLYSIPVRAHVTHSHRLVSDIL